MSCALPRLCTYASTNRDYRECLWRIWALTAAPGSGCGSLFGPPSLENAGHSSAFTVFAFDAGRIKLSEVQATDNLPLAKIYCLVETYEEPRVSAASPWLVASNRY